MSSRCCIARLLNIGTAKCLAIIIVILLGVYHGVLHATYGVTPCKGLLKHGMYKVRSSQINILNIINTLSAGQSVAALGLYDAQIHED